MSRFDQISVLGDPTRRQILELLAKRPRVVGDIAEHLPVTRSAVSQHLRVLKDAGFVGHRSSGTRRLYYVDPEGLSRLRAYLDDMWERALQAFKAEAEKTSGKR